MPPDPEVNPTEAPPPAGETPPPSAPPAPDPVREAVEAARRSAEEAVRISRINYQAAERERAARAATPPPAAPTPEPTFSQSLDPDIERAVEERISRRVDERVKQVVAGIDQVYTRDRTGDLKYRAEQEKREAERYLPRYGDYAAEIDQYMENVPLDLRSEPGAYREAYHVVRGRRDAQAEMEAARRPAPVSSDTRTSTLDRPSPKISREDAAAASSLFGFNLDEKDDILLSDDNGRAVVNIDQFRARRAAK